jgi:hypothetical protein
MSKSEDDRAASQQWVTSIYCGGSFRVGAFWKTALGFTARFDRPSGVGV